jgi:hypothetical protein
MIKISQSLDRRAWEKFREELVLSENVESSCYLVIGIPTLSNSPLLPQVGADLFALFESVRVSLLLSSGI